MLKPEATPDRVAALFAALGDRTRVKLIELLSDGQSRSIRELSSGSPISRQAMTKHLRVLEQAWLVRAARTGREVRFRLEEAELRSARDSRESRCPVGTQRSTVSQATLRNSVLVMFS